MIDGALAMAIEARDQASLMGNTLAVLRGGAMVTAQGTDADGKASPGGSVQVSDR